MDQNNEQQGTQESVPEDNSSSGDMNNSGEQTNEQSDAQQQYAEMKESVENDGGVGDNKTFAILGYILPFLFFLPLINEKSKNNPYARFHANQQLILLIATVGLYLLHNVLYMMLFMGGLFLMQLINIAFLAFMIIGIIHASKGEMKGLPLIGGFNLLK